MQQFHTIGQAARMIGITEKTLRQWASKAHITFERSSTDSREKLITHTDLARLSELHNLTIDHEAVMRDTSLEARITKIEDRLAWLEASFNERMTSLEALIASRPLILPSEQERRLARAYEPLRRIHNERGLPDGYVVATSFAEIHGIRASTVNKALLSGRLTYQKGHWIVGKATVYKALDQDQQAQFFTLYPRAVTCDDPGCSCQTRASF